MSSIAIDQTPEQPRREDFVYTPLNLKLTGVSTGAIEILINGENPSLNSKRFLRELQNIMNQPDYRDDPREIARELQLALSIPTKPLGAASIPQLAALLPEIVDGPPYSQRDQIVLTAVMKRLDGFRSFGLSEHGLDSESALDIVAVRIVIAILAKERSGRSSDELYAAMIGKACELCEQRSLFAADPRDAVLGRLIEFAQQDSRLKPDIATLESRWEDFRTTAVRLEAMCDEAPSLQTSVEESSGRTFDRRDLLNSFKELFTPKFRFGQRRKQERFVREIQDAVAQLSQESEWLDPVAEFREGGTFAQGPAVILDSAFKSPCSWSYDSSSDAERQTFTKLLTNLTDVRYQVWRVFLNNDTLGSLLKELDKNHVEHDAETLCRDLTDYWFRGQETGSLHRFLGSAKPLDGPAFTKLHGWHDSVCQTLADVERECNAAPTVEIVSQFDTVDLSQRTLHFGDYLQGSSTNFTPRGLFRMPRIEFRKAALRDGLLLYDFVLSSAVYTLAERLQLPNGSIVGINAKKLLDLTQWSIKNDFLRGPLVIDPTLFTNGCLLFYIDRKSDGDGFKIVREGAPAGAFL